MSIIQEKTWLAPEKEDWTSSRFEKEALECWRERIMYFVVIESWEGCSYFTRNDGTAILCNRKRKHLFYIVLVADADSRMHNGYEVPKPKSQILPHEKSTNTTSNATQVLVKSDLHFFPCNNACVTHCCCKLIKQIITICYSIAIAAIAIVVIITTHY